MASRLPLQCPLCNRELVDDELDTHLDQSHSKAELVEAVVTMYEDTEEGISE